MCILICAATAAEASSCRSGIRDSKVEGFEVLLTGVGPVRAAKALAQRLLRGPKPRLIISSGFAGALSPNIPVCSWVTAKKIFLAGRSSRDRLRFVSVGLYDGYQGAFGCNMVSSPQLLLQNMHADELLKESMFTPLAVDMESAVLAELAAEQEIPFMVLRLITDTPDAPLPGFISAFTSAMASEILRERVRCSAHGIQQILRDPKCMMHLIKNGIGWTATLRTGWRKHARVLAGSIDEIVGSP